MKNRLTILILTLFLFPLFSDFYNSVSAKNDVRKKYNFNYNWVYNIGDSKDAQMSNYDDSQWEKVDLPRAFNEDEAFRLPIHELTDTIVWYRKKFRIPRNTLSEKVFIEFEGFRQAAEVYINGQLIGINENGIMASGYDLTDYIDFNNENVLAVKVDNSWDYREKSTNSKYQWNDKNFNANYGGITKNTFLHTTGKIYQTLPLFNNLGTCGVYVYCSDFDIPTKEGVINVESEIKNETDKTQHIILQTDVFDNDNKLIGSFKSNEKSVLPGEICIIKASEKFNNLHFWSWGYGYLYDVRTKIICDNKVVDEVNTKTGFRKTNFGEGKVWLNDRVIQLKGYAQRTSNEWPAVGASIPAWLSDYSNNLMVESNGNLVRWMHIAPWKQDIESCDRVGLIQAMPAGDAEKDREGRQWEHRTEVMRDAIIYNRNNPSIIFYECGNKGISREHMIEMIAIRDKYDPHGGRAIGSREMLDIDETEYGGEMLYINKSAKHPMWAMEYSRDEGLRKYWDDYSYPFHKEGDGPLYKGQNAEAYNHNQDMHAIENIIRWHDYWIVRPGNGKRVSSGGTNIIFSDTNTHYRGAENYRRSGETDAMRIPKDGFFAHKVMWDGWVDTDSVSSHIIGHWNYSDTIVKPVYVISSADSVELFLNNKSLGNGKRSYNFLYTFDSIKWEPGELKAVSYNNKGEIMDEDVRITTDEPFAIKLSPIISPNGVTADGSDLFIIEFEVTDKNGRRVPIANNLINFELEGPAEWRGGIAQGENNYILSKSLPVECGVNRILIRTTDKAGKISIKANSDGLKSDKITIISNKKKDSPEKNFEKELINCNLSEYIPANNLPSFLNAGETPATPSYQDKKWSIDISEAFAGANNQNANNSYDDNEVSEWRNDGKLSTAFITYKFKEKQVVDEVSLKLGNWRTKSYPIEIIADNQVIFSGNTPTSLGYVHLKTKPTLTDNITVRLKNNSVESDGFAQITELAEENNLKKDDIKEKGDLRIIEIDILTYQNPK